MADGPRVTAHHPGAEGEVAYIIYTSGSTGEPKGVMIRQGSLLDYFYNHNRVLRFVAGSRVLSFAPFHFDVSIEDTLLPLSLGAFVYQFRGVPAGPLVLRILERERITHMIAVSSLLTLVTRDPDKLDSRRLSALQMVMTGAEVCDPKVINTWKQRLPGIRVINAYGPTEATIVCVTYTVESADHARRISYPIGKPLDGVDVRLMGEDGCITRAGDTGELWIGGSQVMAGYFQRPLETARALVLADGVCFYRSGDLCQWDADGNLQFVGRKDDEVKLGGRRVGLGELRDFVLAMREVSGVAVGTVLIGQMRHIALVAVTARPSSLLAELDRRLASLSVRLRPYVVALAAQPKLSSTGKLDEANLLSTLQDACTLHGATRYVSGGDGAFEPVARSDRADEYIRTGADDHPHASAGLGRDPGAA
jgi:acyl-coenzyme A synthetase/AMP-(fatty) acid ligase